MDSLVFTLLSDGPSDRVLLGHLTWLLTQHVSPTIFLQHEWADLRHLELKLSDLAGRIARAIDLYPCDILFVHRDAELASPDQRRAEIHAALQSVSVPTTTVLIPVISVRMQEAWLLFDEAAIRSAAGNPNGSMEIGLPQLRNIENETNPKSMLHNALRTASGLSGRRLRKMHVHQAALRVADFIDDYSPLCQVPAFSKLEADLRHALSQSGWT